MSQLESIKSAGLLMTINQDGVELGSSFDDFKWSCDE